MFIKPVLIGLVTLACVSAESQATVTPYVVDDTAVKKYALLSNGSFSVNGSTVNGNTGVISGAINSSNNDTLNGNLSYQNGPFSLNSTVTVTGAKTQDFTLSNTISAAATFSSTLANFKATQTLAGDLNNTTITSTGDLNVINLHGNNVNGTITLSGDANDVFYINVWANMNVSGILLANGVLASNVYWNIVGGQNVNLSGNLNGTFLAFNSSGQATGLNINSASINGNVIAGSLNLNSVTITGISAQSAIAVAPEASSMAAMTLFALVVLGSSFPRIWKARFARQAAAA